MEIALKANPLLDQAYQETANKLNGLQRQALSPALKALRQIIAKVEVPDVILRGVERAFPANEPLMVRSSANCEDLGKAGGAGLYKSVTTESAAEVARGVRLVWASLWNERAFTARSRMGIAHEQAYMAVLLQPLLLPDYAFVIHTVNPLNNEANELYVELAVGLGTPLASGDIPGTPYRAICHTGSGEVRMVAFASFSGAFRPGSSGNLIEETIDYSKIPLSTDDDFRYRLIRRLAAIGRFVENAMGAPQDIEGVVQEDKVYLVQTRPQ
jgi:phosphoenolpyruvate synthase/pyruvate phosphate dikinase